MISPSVNIQIVQKFLLFGQMICEYFLCCQTSQITRLHDHPHCGVRCGPHRTVRTAPALIGQKSPHHHNFRTFFEHYFSTQQYNTIFSKAKKKRSRIGRRRKKEGCSYFFLEIAYVDTLQTSLVVEKLNHSINVCSIIGSQNYFSSKPNFFKSYIKTKFCSII